MGLLKYEAGDKVLLQATIKSAEVHKIYGTERVLYSIEESETPVFEESIVERIKEGALEKQEQCAGVKNVTIIVAIGDKEIESFVI